MISVTFQHNGEDIKYQLTTFPVLSNSKSSNHQLQGDEKQEKVGKIINMKPWDGAAGGNQWLLVPAAQTLCDSVYDKKREAENKARQT